MMDSQVVVLRGIHWESQLVKNLDLRESPMVRFQVENLRVRHWESLLVENLELR